MGWILVEVCVLKTFKKCCSKCGAVLLRIIFFWELSECCSVDSFKNRFMLFRFSIPTSPVLFQLRKQSLHNARAWQMFVQCSFSSQDPYFQVVVVGKMQSSLQPPVPVLWTLMHLQSRYNFSSFLDFSFKASMYLRARCTFFSWSILSRMSV